MSDELGPVHGDSAAFERGARDILARAEQALRASVETLQQVRGLSDQINRAGGAAAGEEHAARIINQKADAAERAARAVDLQNQHMRAAAAAASGEQVAATAMERKAAAAERLAATAQSANGAVNGGAARAPAVAAIPASGATMLTEAQTRQLAARQASAAVTRETAETRSQAAINSAVERGEQQRSTISTREQERRDTAAVKGAESRGTIEAREQERRTTAETTGEQQRATAAERGEQARITAAERGAQARATLEARTAAQVAAINEREAQKRETAEATGAQRRQTYQTAADAALSREQGKDELKRAYTRDAPVLRAQGQVEGAQLRAAAADADRFAESLRVAEAGQARLALGSREVEIAERQSAAAMAQAAGQAESLGQGIARAARHHGEFLIATAGLFAAVDVFRNIKEGAAEAQQGVQGLRRVMEGVNDGQAITAQQEFARLSSETNVPIRDVAESTAQFARNFQNLPESLAAARVAVGFTKLDLIDLADSTRYLNVAAQAFHIKGTDLERVIADPLEQVARRGGEPPAQLLRILETSAVVANASPRGSEAALRRFIGIGGAAVRASGQTGRVVATAIQRSIQNAIPREEAQSTIKSFGLDPKLAQTDYSRFIEQALERARKLTPQQRSELGQAIGGPFYGSRVFTPLFQRPEQSLHRLNLAESGAPAFQEELDAQLARFDERVSAIGLGFQRLGAQLAAGGALDGILGLLGASNKLLSSVNAIASAVGSVTRELRQIPILGSVGPGALELGGLALLARRFSAGRFLQGRSIPGTGTSLDPLADVFTRSGYYGGRFDRERRDRDQAQYRRALEGRDSAIYEYGIARDVQRNVAGSGSAATRAQLEREREAEENVARTRQRYLATNERVRAFEARLGIVAVESADIAQATAAARVRETAATTTGAAAQARTAAIVNLAADDIVAQGQLAAVTNRVAGSQLAARGQTQGAIAQSRAFPSGIGAQVASELAVSRRQRSAFTAAGVLAALGSERGGGFQVQRQGGTFGLQAATALAAGAPGVTRRLDGVIGGITTRVEGAVGRVGPPLTRLAGWLTALGPRAAAAAVSLGPLALEMGAFFGVMQLFSGFSGTQGTFSERLSGALESLVPGANPAITRREQRAAGVSAGRDYVLHGLPDQQRFDPRNQQELDARRRTVERRIADLEQDKDGQFYQSDKGGFTGVLESIFRRRRSDRELDSEIRELREVLKQDQAALAAQQAARSGDITTVRTSIGELPDRAALAAAGAAALRPFAVGDTGQFATAVAAADELARRGHAQGKPELLDAANSAISQNVQSVTNELQTSLKLATGSAEREQAYANARRLAQELLNSQSPAQRRAGQALLADVDQQQTQEDLTHIQNVASLRSAQAGTTHGQNQATIRGLRQAIARARMANFPDEEQILQLRTQLAEAERQDDKQAMQDAAARVTARGNLRAAHTTNPIEQARIQLATLEQNLANVDRTQPGAYTQALADIQTARQGVSDAVNQEAVALIQASSALRTAAIDPANTGAVADEAARAAAQVYATQDFKTDSERVGALAAKRQTAAAARRAHQQDAFGDIEFLADIGKITRSQEEARLRGLLKQTQNNKALRQTIQRRLKALADDSNSDLDIDLQGLRVATPTQALRRIRDARLRQQRQGRLADTRDATASGASVSQANTFNITVHGREGADAVFRAIDRALGTTARSTIRASGGL